jgi:S1-C subfamily serine protease
MIRHALPDSIFHGHLDRGDILTSLIFDLPEMQSSSVRLEGNIETHGDISVKRVDGQEDSRFSSRRFSLPEIVDYLVPGSDVEIKFSRKGEKKSVKIKFKNHDQIYRVRSSYHSLRPLQWIQIDGVVMQDTTLNTLAECSRYKYISEIPYYDDLLFEPSVIITYVQPSSEAGALSSFTEGDLVVYVEGQKVHSVEDIKKLSQGKSQISVESDRGAFALLAP